MIGKMATITVILQMLFVASVILDWNSVNGTITVGNCNATTPIEVTMPCLEIADPITASMNITVRTLLTASDLGMRRWGAGLLKNWVSLATIYRYQTLNLNVLGVFEHFCGSFEYINPCVTNSMACPFGVHAAVNMVTVATEVQRLLDHLPLKVICAMNRSTVEGCINQIPDRFKSELAKIVEQIGESNVSQSVQLTDPGIAGRMARSICRKSNEVIQIVQQAANCGATQCNDTVIQELFWNAMLPFLFTPGCNITEESSETRNVTINYIGLGHLQNPMIGSNFETCITNSGQITLVDSENLYITGLIVNSSNSTGHEYSYLTQISIYLFGSKKNCGKAGDTPVKTIFLGKGVMAPQATTTICDGGKKVTVTTLATSQSGSSRFRIKDECANITMIVRYVNVTTLGEVFYLTFRLSKSTKVTGELFSGCATQIWVPGVSDNSSRRKKRATPSLYASLGTYDYETTKIAEVCSLNVRYSDTLSHFYENRCFGAERSSKQLEIPLPDQNES